MCRPPAQGGEGLSGWALGTVLPRDVQSLDVHEREAVPTAAGETLGENPLRRTPSFIREVSLQSSGKALAKVTKYL